MMQNQQTILVVDDMPENIELISAALREQYRIRFALDGENALRIATAESKPDLILLDIVMPGMDGYEVCRRLKENPETQHIPVIFISAMGEVEEERKGLEAGAVDYITKPISQAIVAARVKTHLALKTTADQMRCSEARLNRTLAELELILENASLGIVTIQRTPEARQMCRVNRALEKILGYARGELEGCDTRLIAPDENEYQAFGALYETVLKAGKTHHCEQVLRRKDGWEIYTHAVGVAIDPDNLSRGVIWLIEDVTERRAEQAELEAANAELSVALATVNKTHGALLRAEKLAALGALVAGVAHELSTPIGNAVVVASTMHDQVDEFTAALAEGVKRSTLDKFIDNTRTASDIVLRSLRRAAELIASFKQVAVDQTSSRRRTFMLDEIVAEVIMTLRPSFKKTNFRVENEIGSNLRMDGFPGPLGQVVSNLVNNALIHAFEGRGDGTVRIRARMSDAEHVELIVSDDGNGIAPDDLDKIFDPFFTTRLGRGGSGLGLHIVHTIVTRILDGEIEVGSEQMTGTTQMAGTRFTLRLPVVAPQTLVNQEEESVRMRASC